LVVYPIIFRVNKKMQLVSGDRRTSEPSTGSSQQKHKFKEGKICVVPRNISILKGTKRGVFLPPGWMETASGALTRIPRVT